MLDEVPAKSLKGLYDEVESGFSLIERAFFLVAKGALFGMMISITATTVGRYLFDSPIPGTFEFVEVYLMVAIVFLSASSIQAVGANVSVTAFSRNFPPRARRFALVVGLGVTLLFLWIINRGISGVAWSRYATMATTTGSLNWPTFVSWAIASVGLAILKIRIVFQIVELLMNSEQKVEPAGVKEMVEDVSEAVE